MATVTADSNIWVSGFNFNGKPRRLLRLAASGLVRIDISEEIIQEVLRVLRLKFGWDDGRLREAEIEMNALGYKVAPAESIDLVKEDPTDNRILECAFAAMSGYVVTGDKHLLKLGYFGQAPIVKVAEFFEITEGRLS